MFYQLLFRCAIGPVSTLFQTSGRKAVTQFTRSFLNTALRPVWPRFAEVMKNSRKSANSSNARSVSGS
jgi:hypothetical protein